MASTLIHNWKFNGNSLDSVNQQAPTYSNYDIKHYTGIDLIVQPEQLGAYTLSQLTRDVTSTTYPETTLPDGRKVHYLKWDGNNTCAAYGEVGQYAELTGAAYAYSYIVQFNRKIALKNTMICCWIKPDGITTTGFKLTGPPAAVDITLGYNSGTQKFTLNGVDFGDTVAVENWAFVTIVYKPNQDPVKLYVSTNGKPETAVNFTAEDQYITVAGYTRLYCYDGLYDLRFYDYVADDAAQTIWNLGTVEEVPDSNISSRWKTPKRQFKFNDSPDDNINVKPYYNPLLQTYNSYGASLNDNAGYAPGKIEKALVVGKDNRTDQTKDNTTAALARFPYGVATDRKEGNFTIAFWMSADHILSTPTTYTELYHSSVIGSLVFHKDYGYCVIGTKNFSLPRPAVYPDFDHYAFSYQQYYGRLVVYINGVPRAFVKVNIYQNAYNQNWATDLFFAGPINTANLNGKAYFDDVRTYDSELMGADVTSLYAGGQGTEDGASKGTCFSINQYRLTLGLAKSHVAYTSLFGSRNFSYLNQTVLSLEHQKQAYSTARLIYTFERSHTASALLKGVYKLTTRSNALKLNSFSLGASTNSLIVRAWSHSVTANLFAPYYSYIDQYFGGFSSTVKARYTAPDLSPAIDPSKPTYVAPPFDGIRPFAGSDSSSIRVKNFVPRFPKNSNDGAQIIDKYGNKWTYISKYDSWISSGDTSTPPFVSSTNDGIITPDIYSKLQYLNQWQGNLPNRFKLAPNTDAYFYYFKCSDGLVDIKPEGTNLRFEVNRGRLFNILYRQICPGSPGATGNAGAKGAAGYPAKNELAFIPTFTTFEAKFKVFTTAPLTLDGAIPLPNQHVPDISIRLYSLSNANIVNDSYYYQVTYLNRYFFDEPDMLAEIKKFSAYLDKLALGLQPTTDNGIPASTVYSDAIGTIGSDVLAEILIDPTGKVAPRLNVYNANLDVNRTLASISYDAADNFVTGYFHFNDPIDPYTYAIKSMQKGPDGLTGDSGTSCLEIKEIAINGQHVVAVCPIVNIRLDLTKNTFFTYCSDLINNLCVTYVQLQNDNGALNDRTVMDSTFLSVETTLKGNKMIMKYDAKLKDAPQAELDLTNWTPTDECRTARHYPDQDFNWPGKELDCSPGPFASGALDALGQLANTPQSDSCCQDPFFYFPNVQDAPCSQDSGVNFSSSSSSGSSSSSATSSSSNVVPTTSSVTPTTPTTPITPIAPPAQSSSSNASSGTSSSSSSGGAAIIPYSFAPKLAIGTDIADFDTNFMTAYCKSDLAPIQALTTIQTGRTLNLVSTAVDAPNRATVAIYQYQSAGNLSQGVESGYIKVSISRGTDKIVQTPYNTIMLYPESATQQYFKLVSVKNGSNAQDGLYLTGGQGMLFTDNTLTFLQDGTHGRIKLDSAPNVSAYTWLSMISSPTIFNRAPIMFYWGTDVVSPVWPKSFPDCSSFSSSSSSSSSAAPFKWSKSIRVNMGMTQSFQDSIEDAYTGSMYSCLPGFFQAIQDFFSTDIEYTLLSSKSVGSTDEVIYGNENYFYKQISCGATGGGPGIETVYLKIIRNRLANGSYTYSFWPSKSLDRMNGGSWNHSFYFDIPQSAFEADNWIYNKNQIACTYLSLDVTGQKTWFQDGSTGSTSIVGGLAFERIRQNPNRNPSSAPVLKTSTPVVTIKWS